MTNPSGIKPLGKHILFDVTPKDQQTKGGIFLPVGVQGASTRMEGTVIECGPECAFFEPGQSCYVLRWSSGELVRNGVTYKLALESDIAATLDRISVVEPDAHVEPIDPGM